MPRHGCTQLTLAIAESQRLLLRRFETCDAAAMEGVFFDAEVMRFGRGVQPRDWIEAWIARRVESTATPPRDLWAVVRKSDVRVLGYCGISFFPEIAGSPEYEVGYRLAREFWGQGYATEAARLARDYAFRVLELPRLIALIDPANVASIRVAEKLGMHHEQDVMRPGYSHPDRVYAMARIA